jgi:hypothetical protein
MRISINLAFSPQLKSLDQFAPRGCPIFLEQCLMVPCEMGLDAFLIRKNLPTLWHRALVSRSFSQDLCDRCPWLLSNDRADSAPEPSQCLDVCPHVRMLLQMPLYSIVYRA